MVTDPIWLLCLLAVFTASLIQASAGIGFGLLAMPLLLMALSGHAAVQVTILLSLGLSAILAARTYDDLDRTLAVRLMIGGAVGLPLGLVVTRSTDAVALKLLAAAAVMLFAISVARGPRVRPSRFSSRRNLGLISGSILGGAMGVCLGMPGPPVIGPIREHCASHRSVRATVFAFFVPVYAAALVLQWQYVGIAADTLWAALGLVPAMILGMAAGHWIAPRLSSGLVKVGLVFILFATSLSLILSAIFP